MLCYTLQRAFFNAAARSTELKTREARHAKSTVIMAGIMTHGIIEPMTRAR